MKNETKMSAEKVVKQPKPKLMNIKIEKLHPFENHPYKVLDDSSMTELVESIKEYGLLNRIIVRPLEDNTEEYEIISGHRRVHAAALEIKGSKAEDMLYKGRISYFLGDYKTAQTDLEKAKKDGLAQASYYLAQTYKANGETDKADKCVKEYLDSGVATSYELYDLGAEEMGEGNYTEALTYFNAGLALEKVPNKQNLMKSAISAYEYSGDFTSAKTMLADYLEQYPSDEDAQKESTFLETR